MEELKISLPKEIQIQIELHPEIDWSIVFKKSVLKLLHKLELADFIESKLEFSEFTEEDANKLGELAKQHRLEELKSKGLV
jgi:hypothetical protein